jgi:acyl carrier protein
MGVNKMSNFNLQDKKYFLENYFVEREGSQILEKLFEVDLIQTGLLDSLDIIELAIKIEETFSIKLNLIDNKTFESMRSFNAILKLIE